MNDGHILEVRRMKKHFPIRKGIFRMSSGEAVKAVDSVSFSVKQGERFGLVGESGCGKTTVARTILRIEEPTDGSVHYRAKDGRELDVTTLERRDLKRVRLEIQMVFQDPFSSLNPRLTVRENLAETMIVHKLASPSQQRDIIAQLLMQVGLKPEYMARYPHAFSGGQRQRIAIARTLTVDPSIVICDESVSSLDVSVQAQILNLLQSLGESFGLTYLFIAHDLSVVYHFCDRLAVMYLGKIVEQADTSSLFDRPLHPYTEALISATPNPDPGVKKSRIVLSGEVPSAINPPPGCPFHPRCRYAEDVCRTEVPELEEEEGRLVSCHRYRELTLEGAPFEPEVSE
jgi:peptide/nickel transport system ATP-binding protein